MGGLSFERYLGLEHAITHSFLSAYFKSNELIEIFIGDMISKEHFNNIEYLFADNVNGQNKSVYKNNTV